MTPPQTRFILVLTAACLCGTALVALAAPPSTTPAAASTLPAPASAPAAAPEDPAILAVRARFEQSKKDGATKWGSQNWMKEPDYYARLSIEALSEECFAKTIFANEMSIYAPSTGLEDLRVFHNGFAELLRRPDMWKGILHAYDHLGAKINLQADLPQIVSTSDNLGQMGNLLALSPLKEQVKGRERPFFEANLGVLKRYDFFLQNFDPVKLGTNGSPGFFGEPTWITTTTLKLAEKIDPAKYAQVAPDITGKRFGPKQDVKELRDYVHLVIEKLDVFVDRNI